MFRSCVFVSYFPEAFLCPPLTETAEGTVGLPEKVGLEWPGCLSVQIRLWEQLQSRPPCLKEITHKRCHVTGGRPDPHSHCWLMSVGQVCFSVCGGVKTLHSSAHCFIINSCCTESWAPLTRSFSLSHIWGLTSHIWGLTQYNWALPHLLSMSTNITIVPKNH